MNTVYIFRDGKKYYYKCKNEIQEINEISLNKLTTTLKLPYEFIFKNLSLAQREKIISKFLTRDVICQNGLNEFNEHKVTFIKRKYKVEAYCMTSRVNLEGRSENCKLYILTTLGDNKILMEVTRDYVLNSPEPYYFLRKDMVESERNFFSSVYCTIECDYVYNLVLQEDKNQVLGRKRRK